MFAISEIQADRALRCQLSGKSAFEARLLEKDFVITAILQAVSTVEAPTGTIQFGGGTSLVKAWRLPNRLSEDIDLKYAPDPTLSRRKQNDSLRTFRALVEDTLLGMGFLVVDRVGELAPSEFFSLHLAYESRFESGSRLEPIVRLECKREAMLVSPESRVIHSIADVIEGVQEDSLQLMCTRPEEIAAQKIWIVLGEIGFFRESPRDTRHLFDLWQLSELELNHAVLAQCFLEVGLRREVRKFNQDFWAIAESNWLRNVFESELSGLTPELPEFERVLSSLRYFQSLLDN